MTAHVSTTLRCEAPTGCGVTYHSDGWPSQVRLSAQRAGWTFAPDRCPAHPPGADAPAPTLFDDHPEALPMTDPTLAPAPDVDQLWPAHLVREVHNPAPGQRCTAVLDTDGRYRYLLTRRWAAGAWCAFVMLNPSTADAATDDATIRRCTGYARRWGFAGLLVLNLFAFRARHPADMLRAGPAAVGPDNDQVITAAFVHPEPGVGRIDRVIVAWGAKGAHLGRDVAVSRLLRDNGVTPFCLGLSADGRPVHPLYQPRDVVPIEYPTAVR